MTITKESFDKTMTSVLASFKPEKGTETYRPFLNALSCGLCGSKEATRQVDLPVAEKYLEFKKLLAKMCAEISGELGGKDESSGLLTQDKAYGFYGALAALGKALPSNEILAAISKSLPEISGSSVGDGDKEACKYLIQFNEVLGTQAKVSSFVRHNTARDLFAALDNGPSKQFLPENSDTSLDSSANSFNASFVGTPPIHSGSNPLANPRSLPENSQFSIVFAATSDLPPPPEGDSALTEQLNPSIN